MSSVRWMGTASGWQTSHVELTDDLTQRFVKSGVSESQAASSAAIPVAAGATGLEQPAAAVPAPTSIDSSDDDQKTLETCCFDNASEFTVRVRGFAHHSKPKGLLERGENDIMIVTKHSFNSEPWITRVHFRGTDVPEGWHSDFFEDTVVAKRDFKVADDRRLDLHIQIYDVDQLNLNLVELVKGTADAASGSIAFTNPVLASYVGLAGAGLKALAQQAEQLDQHDPIIEQRLVLELAIPSRGRTLLQPGFFVCFENDVDTEKTRWWLDSHLHVLCQERDGSEGAEPKSEFKACSYVVIEVSNDFSGGREWVIDQKVTKLVSELHGKGQSGEAPLHFLRQTLRVYDNFKRLERARSLLDKPKPSPEEASLLQELQNDPELAPYLKPLTRDGQPKGSDAQGEN